MTPLKLIIIALYAPLVGISMAVHWMKSQINKAETDEEWFDKQW